MQKYKKTKCGPTLFFSTVLIVNWTHTQLILFWDELKSVKYKNYFLLICLKSMKREQKTLQQLEQTTLCSRFWKQNMRQVCLNP